MQTTTAPALAPQEIDTVLTATAGAVEAHFLDVERGRAVATHLRDLAARGRYAGLPDPAALAEQVTADMQAVQPDLHLRLLHRPEGAVDHADAAAEEAHWREEARRTAGGVRGVRRLEGNVAVLDLAPALSHPAYGGGALASALALVADADALVIDLRDCLGGSPETVAMVCGHLLGEEPVPTIDFESATGRQQFWTPSWVPGPRFGQVKPVAVLLSPRTFSGGEELAFDLQELGRATLVGERTRGGAHPRVGVRVHDHLEVTVPCARAVSPRTGINWEGVGITPDLPVPEAEAPDVALAHLRSLLG